MTSRRDDLSVTPLSAALTAMIRELSQGRRGAHAELWARWREIVGAEMYRRSFPVSLRGKTLVVGVVSSSWLHEMSFLKTALLDRLAEEIGPGVVSEIKLVLDTSIAGADGELARDGGPAGPSRPDPGEIPPELRAELERLPDAELRAGVERAIAAALAAQKPR
jgi:hypothetical protein